MLPSPSARSNGSRATDPALPVSGESSDGPVRLLRPPSPHHPITSSPPSHPLALSPLPRPTLQQAIDRRRLRAALAAQPAEYSWRFAKMQLEAMETLLADAKARLAEHPRDARLALTAIIRARPHIPPNPPSLPPTDGETCEAAAKDFWAERERTEKHNDYLELLEDQVEREAREAARAAKTHGKRTPARAAEKTAQHDVARAAGKQTQRGAAAANAQKEAHREATRAPDSPPSVSASASPPPPVPQSPSPPVAPPPPSPPSPPPRTPPLDPFFSQPLARFDPPEYAKEIYRRRAPRRPGPT